jgi:acid phosphatase family membrane protein YuiD
LAIIFGSPAALVGGLIGSRVPKEGGQTEQFIMAAIFGVILALPFACMGLWFFTGW